MTIEFRRLTAEDLAQLHEWLQRPHVRRWWSKYRTLEDVADHYRPAIEGTDPTDLYFCLFDGEPCGFVQTYIVSDHPDYDRVVGTEDGVAGVDLFIADEGQLGRGLGTRVLQQFLRDVVFARPATIACIADPEVENRASLRAFEKAGFRLVREFVDPEDRKPHALMRIDR